MTFSKDSPPNTSTPSLSEQLRIQRLLEQESRSLSSDNAAEERSDSNNAAEESDSLSSVAFHLVATASAPLRTQRQFQQESSRSSAPNNEDSVADSLPPSGLGSSTAAPTRGSHRTSLSRDRLRSILNSAIAILDDNEDEDDEDDEEVEDASRRDDSNSQP
jgi:hypothetical protein